MVAGMTPTTFKVGFVSAVFALSRFEGDLVAT